MKKSICFIISIILVISLGLSVFQGFRRHQVENSYRDVQIIINYDDIKQISIFTQQPIDEIARKFKEAGATGALVKERTVRPAVPNAQTSLEEIREVVVYEGNHLIALSSILDKEIDISNLSYANRYLWIPDLRIRNAVAQHLNSKFNAGEALLINSQVLLNAGPINEAIFTTGVGYPIEDLEVIAKEGLTISPQIRDWDVYTQESLDIVFDEIKALPSVNGVYFNDVTLPKIDTQHMRELATTNQIGYIEFYSNRQRGIDTLIRGASQGGTNYNMIRMHSVPQNLMTSLSKRQLLDRYLLAVTERNIRSLFVRTPRTSNAENNLEVTLDFISSLKSDLNREGYTVQAQVENMQIPLLPGVLIWLIGMGPLSIILILGSKIKQYKISIVITLLGVLCWTGLLKVQPLIAKQIMALFAATIFPVVGVIWVINKEPRSILQSIYAFLAMSLVSFGGAITVIGLLSDSSFTLGINIFRGVKVASFLPLILVPIILIFKYNRIDLSKIKETLSKPISYIILVVLAVMALVIFRYLQRTGNTATVSEYELMFRQLLNRVLGVRPRTKEFLIGHPLMILILVWGYKKKLIPIIVLAIVGQASIVNTFAHLHTPVIISLIRTFHGIWIGIIIGVIATVVLRLAFNVFKPIGGRLGLWEK